MRTARTHNSTHTSISRERKKNHMFDIAFKWLNEGNQTKRKTLIIIQHVFGAQIFLVLIHSCYCVTTLKWLMMPLFNFFPKHTQSFVKKTHWMISIPTTTSGTNVLLFLLHLPYCWVILRAHEIKREREKEREEKEKEREQEKKNWEEKRPQKNAHYKHCETGVQVYLLISLRHSTIALCPQIFTYLPKQHSSATCPHALLQIRMRILKCLYYQTNTHQLVICWIVNAIKRTHWIATKWRTNLTNEPNPPTI